MTYIKYIQHPSDRDDFINDIRDKPMGFCIIAEAVKPSKSTDRYEQWLQANGFFHKAIMVKFSRISGYSLKEAKEILQIRNALVAELPDSYLVESISSMSLDRLVEFNEVCMSDMVSLFGEMVSMTEYELKERLNVKPKKIIKNGSY